MISRCAHLLIASLVMLQPLRAQETDSIRWAPDFETARKASAQFNVPLLIHFYGDHCLPCETLEQRVFSRADVVETLNKYFVCVKINTTEPEGRSIAAEQFQVHSSPTDVFLSPDAKNLHQGVCPQDPAAYMQVLQNVAVRNRDRNVMLASKQATRGNPAPDSPTQQSGVYTNPAQIAPPSMHVTAQQLAAARAARQDVTATAQTRLIGHQVPASRVNPTLGASVAPSPQVQSGPLANSQQPVSLAASTPAFENQIAGPQAPVSNNSYGGGLPPVQNVARLTGAAKEGPSLGPMPGAGLPNQLGTYAVMPQRTASHTPSEASGELVEKPFTTAAAQLGNTVAKDLENPYFEASQVSQSTMAARPEQPPVNLYRRRQNAQQTLQIPAPPSPANFASLATPESMTPQAPATEGGFVASNPEPPLPSETNAQIAAKPDTEVTPTFQPAAEATTTKPQTQLVSAPMGQVKVASEPIAVHEEAVQDHAVHEEAVQDHAVHEEVAPQEESVQDKAETELSSDELGLEGYCPVVLHKESKWVGGNSELAVKHRGKVYWLSSQEAYDQFLANPDACSPLLSGFDPYVLVEEGKLVPGDIRYGLHDVVSGKYMLFASQQAKDAFWADFDRYLHALGAVIEHSKTSSK